MPLSLIGDDRDTLYIGLDDFIKGKLPCSSSEVTCYNILAFDGSGLKGIVPAMVVDYMENKSYEYSLSQGYVNASDYPESKIPMSKLFQMIAGSSTGSILVEYFETKGPDVFETQGLSTGWLVTYTMLGLLFGAIIGLRRGHAMYDDPIIDLTHVSIRIFIKTAKTKSKPRKAGETAGSTT